ncbi:MAG: DUF885 domain-containing protein [Acidobacteria bacterium]|nr:DUF885 domain-containing protein [Acidobacteriota bacterium]
MTRPSTPEPSEPLAHFVEDYLGWLHGNYPTEAAVDGIHAHDDLLEDLSREGIDARIRDLGGWARRLEGISEEALTQTEGLERRMLADRIRARLFELEEVRDWERNPLVYADTLATSLAAQVLFAYTELPNRARRVGSKLRQVPRLVSALERNVQEAPGLFVKTGTESLRGLVRFIDHDLPRAFRDLDDLHLLGDLADASTEATRALEACLERLRARAPQSRASFRLGRDRFERKLRLEEGIDVPADRLLQVARRELAATQEEFARVASEIDKDPREAWRQTKARHPSADELIPVAAEQVEKLRTFLERKRIVTIPPHAGVVVRPTPDFYRWTFASLWTPGPFESTPLPAYYYLTNVDAAWDDARQQAHLRDMNHAALWSISTHEVFPGHFLHFEHLRQVAAPLRKSNYFAATSFVEGWAHYAEQMVLEEGFERGDPEIRLGQLAEALVRLARTVVGIRLHTEDLSVEQGVRFFRDAAYLEAESARAEAERGTYDPSYVLYALGKQMLRKLRADVAHREGEDFTVQRFHDGLLAQGSMPFWMHRALMAADGALID